MKVLRANMFRNSLSVLNENNEELELTLEEWQALEPHRPEAPQQQGAGQGKPQPKPAASPATGRDAHRFRHAGHHRRRPVPLP